MQQNTRSIIEQTMEYIKDRIEDFDDYFHVVNRSVSFITSKTGSLFVYIHSNKVLNAC